MMVMVWLIGVVSTARAITEIVISYQEKIVGLSFPYKNGELKQETLTAYNLFICWGVSPK